jgi:cellulose synthase/poly-beta-1,6-N-acetylglucosamine synthase-like glycosyltransferase
MIILLQIIFWLSIFSIFYSYVLFPFFLAIIPKKQKNDEFSKNDNLPKVSILISIYNEELVISEKIETILASDYPLEKIELLIGSDCSNDKSNEIVSEFVNKNNIIKFFPFTERQGKPSVINKLFQISTGDIIILTDANVMFDKNSIFELVKFFKDKTIGLVDSQMINKGIVKNGISVQESSYISREVKIKNNESNIWGTMMGPFGGCYAIRKTLFQPVPPNFLVDDFYINMKVLEQGYKAINNTKAIVFEDVSNNLSIEFKRKIRIATGNFQNLAKFKHLLFAGVAIKSKKIAITKHYNSFGLAFSFYSHKILRWIIPFIIITIAVSGAFLLENIFYLVLYSGFIFSILLPFFDILLKKININISILRFITHFYSMNIALLVGFFRYSKGVKSGVWQPTKRNQTTN